MLNSSIWSIDRILSGATTLGQSGPGSNCNEGVLHILQSSKIGASPSDCLLSYLRHLLENRDLTPQQRCSQCILQPQPIGLDGKCKQPHSGFELGQPSLLSTMITKHLQFYDCMQNFYVVQFFSFSLRENVMLKCCS